MSLSTSIMALVEDEKTYYVSPSLQHVYEHVCLYLFSLSHPWSHNQRHRRPRNNLPCGASVRWSWWTLACKTSYSHFKNIWASALIVNNWAIMHTSKHVGRCCLQHLCHWPRRFHAILNLSYVFSGSDWAKLLWVWYLKTKLSSISTFNTNFFSNRIFKLSSSYYFNPARIELSELSWARSHGERKTSVFISIPIPQAAAPRPRSNRRKKLPPATTSRW